MKYCSIAFLLCAITAFAQPIHGPFTVLNSDDADIGSLQIAATNSDSIYAFYVDGSNIKRTAYSLELAEIFLDPQQLRHDNASYLKISNVCMRSHDNWALALRTQLVDTISIRCIFQSENGLHDSYITRAVQYWLPFQWESTSIIDQYVAPWNDDRWFIGYIRGGQSQVEYFYNGSIEIVDSEGAVSSHNIECAQDENFELCDNGPYYCKSIPINDSTALSLYNANPYIADSSAIIINNFAEEFSEPIVYPIGCSWTGLDLQRTRSGRLISFMRSEDAPPGIATMDTNGVCDISTLPDEMVYPHQLAYHPDYGWALLLYNQNYLSVATVDTNGTLITSPGILYWHEGETAIIEADIALTDDGKIVVLWSERDSWNEPAARLRVAWTNWETQLGSIDNSRQPLPESISLIAFPNPFNSEVRIEYSLPRSGNVSLSVFNLNGQLVEQLERSYIEAGTHSLVWQPNTTSGVYFMTLQTNSNTATQKILYLK